jgi:hypothetical protein
VGFIRCLLQVLVARLEDVLLLPAPHLNLQQAISGSHIQLFVAANANFQEGVCFAQA